MMNLNLLIWMSEDKYLTSRDTQEFLMFYSQLEFGIEADDAPSTFDHGCEVE
jgi:hypothetical protein